MSRKDAEEPLLERTPDSSQHGVRTNALTKRRYRCSTSVPETESVCHTDHNNVATVPLYQPDSIFANKLDFRLVLVLLLAYICLGALCFFLVRDEIKGQKTNGIVDAVYFCVVTMTTVGYGDLVPNSTTAKFLACVFVFMGMALVGFLLSKAADSIVENQEIYLVKAIHMYEKSGPLEILKEVETNKVKYKVYTVLILLLMLVIVGILFLHKNEELGLFDAFYCVCATITTLGYGDKSFSTSMGRVFAAFWILISTICLAQFFYTLAELYTERRTKSLVKWVLSRKLTVSDLEAADLDNDKVISAAEFVIYKLKEMGKICEEDVAMVMEWFNKLDVDQSGTLTKADLQIPDHQKLRK